jgi:hypothetical protein
MSSWRAPPPSRSWSDSALSTWRRGPRRARTRAAFERSETLTMVVSDLPDGETKIIRPPVLAEGGRAPWICALPVAHAGRGFGRAA